MSKERKNCMCTAMLYDPADHREPEETKEDFKKNSKIYERLMEIRQSRLLRFFNRKQNNGDKNEKDKSVKMVLKYFFKL